MWSPLHGAEPSASVWAHCVPLPDCRIGVIGLAIASNPENDGHLSPWQEPAGHQIIPDTHKNGCANEATTGPRLGLFQDVVFG